jgi:hypothetical protein
MVYGPGGYKFMDYVYMGGPMQIFLWLLTVLMLVTTTTSNFYISWIASFAVLLAFWIVIDFRSWFPRRNDPATKTK